MDDATWSVRVVAAGRDRADAYVRQHKLRIGPPLHFDPDFPGVTALETVLAALGGELVNGFAAAARRHRLQVDHLEATVDARLGNPLIFLGVVGEAGDPGLERVHVVVYASTVDDPELVARAWRETLSRCPLVVTLRRAATLELDLKIAL